MKEDTTADQESVGMNVEQLTEIIEVRSDDDNVGLGDIWMFDIPLGKIINSIRRDVDNVEKEVREVRSSGDNPMDQTDDDEDEQDDLLPIERIAQLKEDDEPDENPFADTTPSVDRAVVLFNHFRDWSNKVPKGRVIKNGLKNLLNTAMDATLSWKQVYRSCRKLEEWSKGRITFKKVDRHGWILVDSGTSSSAASG